MIDLQNRALSYLFDFPIFQSFLKLVKVLPRYFREKKNEYIRDKIDGYIREKNDGYFKEKNNDCYFKEKNDDYFRGYIRDKIYIRDKMDG